MAGHVMTLIIMTGSGELYHDAASYINLPSTDGTVGILPGHAPMLCAVAAGTVLCRHDGAEARIEVGSGVAEVLGDVVTLLVQLPSHR